MGGKMLTNGKYIKVWNEAVLPGCKLMPEENGGDNKHSGQGKTREIPT
jgi:hypothetical protein